MGRLVRVAVAVVVVAFIAYAVGSFLLYDAISSVTALCSDRAGDGPRFQENSPAGWSLANDGDVDVRWPPSSRTFDMSPYAMPEFEDVTVPSRDARIGALAAWWVPGRTAASPAVVVVHGRGSCRRDHVVLLPAGMLHRAGFGVLLIDVRDQGDSPVEDGRFTGGSQEYRDVLDARDWIVREKGLSPEQVGLLGTSLGAASVIIAAGSDPTVAATWEDSGFGDVERMIRDEITYRELPDWLNVLVPGGLLIARVAGTDPRANDPLTSAAAIGSRPFAIVHGARDPHIPVQHALDLAEAAAGATPGLQPWVVQCAHHVEAAFCATSEYEQHLVEFFTEALGAP